MGKEQLLALLTDTKFVGVLESGIRSDTRLFPEPVSSQRGLLNPDDVAANTDKLFEMRLEK